MSSRTGRTFRTGSGGFPPAVLWISVVQVGLWLVLLAFPPLSEPAWPWLSLSTSGLLHGRVWQLLTFQVLHHPGDVLGIAFNTYFLVVFGRTLEWRWGTRYFAAFYLGCGAAGGLLYVLLALIYGEADIAGSMMPLLAILLVSALLWPEQRILLFFVIPVPIRAAVAIIAIIEVAVHWRVDLGIANLALFGSMIVAWLWVRQGWRVSRRIKSPPSLLGWWRERKMARRRKKMTVVDRDWDRWFEDDEKTPRH